jgi:hypothetical protein
MQIREDFEFLESLFVGLDALEDGFGGVLLEIHRRGDECILLEMASTTGNHLLRFSSKDRELVYAALVQELGASLRQTLVGLPTLLHCLSAWGSLRRLRGSQGPLVEIFAPGRKAASESGDRDSEGLQPRADATVPKPQALLECLPKGIERWRNALIEDRCFWAKPA